MGDAGKVDQEALRRAIAGRRELEAITEKLNATIGDCEAAIRGLQLGVTGSVVLEVDPETGRTEALAWGKLRDEWRLIYEHTAGKSSTPERVPLVNANRTQRLNAVPHLARLVNELVERTAKELEKVEAATGKVREFIAAFDRSKP